MTRSLNRNKSGEERIENKITSNINDLVEVDLGLPFYFADKDLIVDKSDNFQKEDVLRLLNHFEKNGWRLPTKKDFFNNVVSEKNDGTIIMDFLFRKREGKNEFYLELKGNGNKIELPFESRLATFYWLGDDIFEKDCIKLWLIENGLSTTKIKLVVVCDVPFFVERNKMKIRLIKDK